MLTTPELISILVRMKVRLSFGAAAGTQSLLNVLIAIIGTAATAGGVALVLWTQGADDQATQLMLLLTSICLLWFVLSIIAGAGESVLNPGLFAMYPISVRQLIVAFLAAAFVGVAAPGTTIVALSAISHSSNIASALLIGVGALVVTTTAVLSGRYGIAIMSSLVRGRGTREVAGLFAALIGGLVGIAPQFIDQLRDRIGESERGLARDILRWIPWGWGPESMASAAEGRLGRAALFLILAAVFAVALGEAWRRTLERILTTRPAASEATTIEGGLVYPFLRPLGRHCSIAVMSRTTKQLRRDPREFLEVVSFMPIVLVSGFPALEALRSGNPEVVLAVTGVGLALGITSLNMFGADGKSFGVDLFAAGDLTPVIFGKALARALVAAPLILLSGLILAVISGGWVFLAASYMIAATALLAMLAVGMTVSVRYPAPLADQVAFGGGSSGANGCATAIIRFAGLLVALIVAAVGVVPAILVSTLVSPALGTLVGCASVTYGLSIFWFAGRAAGKRATEQAPELFQTLSTPL